MNAVMGMTQLLLDTPLSAEQREYAESARRGGDGLLTVINDVLDFSKIEARKVSIVPIPLNLRVLLTEVLQLLMPGATQKGLKLELKYPSNSAARFSGDATRIRQIALNLVSNAIKYTERGGVEVSVAVAQGEAGPEVTIGVADTGIGIAEDMRPMLFQEFSQLDQRMARKYGGTGLGLAISKKLAELMGGHVGVESEVGKGSTFWCRLPLTEVEGVDLTPDAGPNESVQIPAHVLVAEDNAVNRRVAVAFLRKLGCTVETAADGAAAVRMWRSGNYDLVFMDCQMPEVDGYAATSAIRALETAGQHTPIIAMTAHAMEGDREMCLRAGMDDYLPKPLDLRELTAALSRWAPAMPGCA